MSLATDARPRAALQVLVALAIAFAVLVRLYSASALWLDEALSVNIASLPLSELPQALRQDGSPPLFYLLLHGWMEVFGTGTSAVRALSTVFALTALPLACLAGRRLGDTTTGWVALLLAASAPFLVRYSAETRMYSIVVVLVLLGVIALHSAFAAPTIRRLLAVSGVTVLLLLTHYWSLYLLAVTGGLLVGLSVRGPRRAAARRCVLAMAGGGLLFLPWLPSFLFQLRHTGTPWARPPKPVAVLDTISTWAGGRTLASGLLVLVLAGLLVLALLGRRTAEGVVLRRPVAPIPAVLLLVALGTLALGLALAVGTSAGYAPRYSAVAITPFLLACALGAAVLPPRARLAVVALAVGLGLIGCAQIPLSHKRTQAPQIAQALRAGLQPPDLVVYCPDQNGPAVSRLLSPTVDQVVYPTMGSPLRIDWRDYAERNAAASPDAFAQQVLSRTPGAIWLVARDGHRTFDTQCERLDAALAQARGSRTLVVQQRASYGERADLIRFPPQPAGG